MPFAPSPAEVAIVNQIFVQGDPQKLGLVTGEQGIRVFAGAKLPPATLGDIWSIADPDNNGALTRKGVAIAVRLIGWAQNGETPSSELLEKVGPLPVIDGLVLPAVSSLASRAPAPIAIQPFSLPPLLPQDRAKFLGLFNKTNPGGGLLGGEQARGVFLRSKLPMERLNTIWNLVDTQNRGALDSTQFILAMYFIQGSMTATPTIPLLPVSIPPYLWEQAGGRPPSVHSHNSGETSPTFQSPYANKPFTPQYAGASMSTLQQQTTGDLQARSQFIGQQIMPQITGSRVVPAIPLRPSNLGISPQVTGSPFPLARQGALSSLPWDVTAEEKANSDGFFDSLDAARLGYVEGGAAVPFMLLSGLPEDILARVWDLADMRNDGRLTKDTFAVAMHLINSVLGGKDLPAVLPITLIPPSLRGPAGLTPFPPPVPIVSEAHQDLLSLDDDLSVSSPPQVVSPPRLASPPAPVPVISHIAANVLNPVAQTPPVVSAPSRGQYGRDLLDDEEAEERQTKKLADNNVGIANIRNQLSSTTNAHEAAQQERVQLEADLATSAATLSQLQTQLASAKVGYDTETKLLAGLRERYQAQATEILTTRDALIRAESELSGLRQEKSEVGGNLLREKDDVRDLKRRIAEVTEEISSIRKEIEQTKKDARMQKGLLAIAKKQLSTAESDKEAAEKELNEAKEEAEKAEAEVAQTESAVATLKERSLPNSSASLKANGAAIPGSASPKRAASMASPPVATPPLPFTEVSNAASPAPSIKSNNPFDRLRQSSVSDASVPQRSTSPFTPSAFSAEPATFDSANEDDPFGFNEATNSPQIPVTTTNSTVGGAETPRQQSSEISNGVSEKAPSSPEHNQLITPSDTFFTPPSSSAGNTNLGAFLASEQESSAGRFPPLAEDWAQSPKLDSDIPPMMDIVEKADESSSDSDDDDRPLGQVKAEKQAGPSDHQVSQPAPVEQSFEDAFEIPVTSKATSIATNTAPSSHFSTMGSEQVLSSPAVSTVPSNFAPAVNGHHTGASPVNAFDEAMGLMPSVTSTAPASEAFKFDKFEDTFDFGENSFSHGKTSSTENAIPPITARSVASASFDDAFGLPAASAASAAKPAAIPLSFDDAFEVTTNGEKAAPNQGFAFPIPEPVPASVRVDTTAGYAVNNGVVATGSSVRSDSPTAVRGSSSSARATSPPPRTSSPKLPPASPRPRPAKETVNARPGSSLTPDAAGPSRSSRLSIHFPFRRSKSSKEKEKKDKSGKEHVHDNAGGVMPPVPTIPEDYAGDRYDAADVETPDPDGDIPPLRQLTELGFTREKALAALESTNYNFQKALNKLLAV